MNNKITPSVETQNEAMKIAKATQKPGQTKEQTKLIAQGIEKGIAQYKKQLKEKSRQADKAQKKRRKEKLRSQSLNETAQIEEKVNIDTHLKLSSRFVVTPWILLAISWVGFIIYIAQ
ncbi:DUF2956 domain-containing protein [Vibrio caribbeanicus]|uniref:DUF2956 domain-containing protein n=1 Tax=Vibrio caribbeanicus TaxID=701175 RepID=UPI0022845B6C|nr:DUF2956 domain-containing protein [Vibrio caribbeanicus]MCY9845240.1 DUF2956 domain-containing protein [Vibrio caribbeanicus]